MKTYPAKWQPGEVAFFAGLLSSLIALDELVHIVDECARQAVPGRKLYFTDLITRIEPLIPAPNWRRVVLNCERLFKK